ncbi:MAG: T9SS type A sorting domain-containing protein, partial [Bacteroidia bacterium]|nr:T9SS type A sorting domain-containing protein [Bacteroidia bacterium]
TKEANVFPNPAVDRFSVELQLTKPEYLNFELYDSQGKLVAVLLRDWVKTLENVFSFRTTELPKGVYFLKITGNYNTAITKKVIVQ